MNYSNYQSVESKKARLQLAFNELYATTGLFMQQILYPKNVSFATIKAAAQNHWRRILSLTGIPEQYLKKRHGACPACGGKDRFRFDDKNGDGTFYCNQCGAGDGFKLIQLFHGCTPAESLRIVSDVLGGSGVKPVSMRQKIISMSDKAMMESNHRKLCEVWNEAQVITAGDAVYRYLTEARRLRMVEIPNVLRLHSGLPYYDGNKCLGYFPTMLARVENAGGELVSIHRTYLTAEGHKAFGKQSKKLMLPIYDGATSGAAIRLYESVDTLILAEGIETALCGATALNLPGWACVSTHGLQTVKLSDSVQQVIILVDNDASGAGQQAAAKLTNRLISEGRKVKCLVPPELGTDWLDLLAKAEGY